ncbi:hypothetical protein LSH36_270g05089 [Paralvinella palmiformis]|uniref:Uncharacterized protein n=1 Tax=Paralvinella palmiformis TaxID=53620 RepID=A0AAD9N3S2_9ANNE|nr:hypothetical protein LSH36_270g05089 [Paralvinella palmiformis]
MVFGKKIFTLSFIECCTTTKLLSSGEGMIFCFQKF